uniref:Uncharacterized protein n=1 Tax=Cannabis sativa TaxID=3483 RepID=A0A803PT52_CANSA
MAAAERRPSVPSKVAGLLVRRSYGTIGRSMQLLEKFTPRRSLRLVNDRWGYNTSLTLLPDLEGFLKVYPTPCDAFSLAPFKQSLGLNF